MPVAPHRAVRPSGALQVVKVDQRSDGAEGEGADEERKAQPAEQ